MERASCVEVINVVADVLRGNIMQTIYIATRNSDSTEGRGHTETIAAFFDEKSAKQAVKGWGVMGVGDGDVEKMDVYDSFAEYDPKSVANIRKKALSKLTHEEKKSLGWGDYDG